MVAYDRAVAIWIGRQTGDDPDTIGDIEFDTIQEGYCETCEYTTMGITYTVNKKSGRSFEELTMKHDSPAEFIREVSEIIQESG